MRRWAGCGFPGFSKQTGRTVQFMRPWAGRAASTVKENVGRAGSAFILMRSSNSSSLALDAVDLWMPVCWVKLL